MSCHRPAARRIILGLLALGISAPARAELPTGYLVWSKGTEKDPSTRRLWRLTLPGKTDAQALTSGEDVEPQVSPDGKWVAYAKAKIGGGSDYHSMNLWKLYLVSIHGVGGGRQEMKIDDNGYWPSWSGTNVLNYSQVDGTHTRIMRVTLSETGKVIESKVFFTTKTSLGAIDEINECFVAPDSSWFAARTRGTSEVTGVGAYPTTSPTFNLLARAGAVGCMPYVAPSGTWGLIAGAENGVRWGDAPSVAGRKQDQLLIAAKGGGKAYHPGISTDEKWALCGHGTDQDHNSGAYDLYIYKLDAASKTVSDEQLLAGGGFNGWPHVWVGTPTPPPPPKPSIEDFYPSSYTVGPGEKVTLSWVAREATSAELDGEVQPVEGSKEVAPLATTSYALIARNTAVSDIATATVEVTVNATPQPVVIESFTATAEKIDQGQSTTLSWRVRNPTTLDVNGQRAAPTGSLELGPQETTTYTLTARGSGGPVTRSLTITVKKLDVVGQLPDKGGFLCALAVGSIGAPCLATIALLLGLGLWLSRRRRTPSATRG
jgi:hypothetical protein